MPKDVTKKESKENKHFFKDFKAELKRVIWPTPKQLVNNTVAVITIVLITAVIVFALDFVFKSIDDYGISKLRNFVNTNNEQVENNTTNEEGQNEEANTQNNEQANNEQTNTSNDNNQAENSQDTNNTVNE